MRRLDWRMQNFEMNWPEATLSASATGTLSVS
jgi:hypothetical protein